MACKWLNELSAGNRIHVLCQVGERQFFSGGGCAWWVAGHGCHVECWCCLLLLGCKEVGEWVNGMCWKG